MYLCDYLWIWYLYRIFLILYVIDYLKLLLLDSINCVNYLLNYFDRNFLVKLEIYVVICIKIVNINKCFRLKIILL